MIKRLQNPLELVISLKMLNVISLSDEESEKRIEKIVSKHLGKKYDEFEPTADQQLESLDDDEKVQLTRQSLLKLQDEEDSTKKEILLMFEEIIFADEEVLSSERTFYDIAKRLLQVNTYEIEPSVELFEYLNVLNYVSSSDFASIDEFAEIWIKYMGPDIRVYYNEAYQNLKNLDLETQIALQIHKRLLFLRNHKNRLPLHPVCAGISWGYSRLNKFFSVFSFEENMRSQFRIIHRGNALARCKDQCD